MVGRYDSGKGSTVGSPVSYIIYFYIELEEKWLKTTVFGLSPSVSFGFKTSVHISDKV